MNYRSHDRLTYDEKILLAASAISAESFTAEELIVATYLKFPKDFSLMGFPQYPDSNKVLTQITNSGRGLQKKGWLIQIGKKRYKNSLEGLRYAQKLVPDQVTSGIRTDDRDIADMLKRWTTSVALNKYQHGGKDALTERDALSYWGLTAGSSATRTDFLFAIAKSAVAFLQTNVDEGLPSEVHHNVMTISVSQAKLLIEVHNYLEKQFQEAIRFLKSQRR